MSFLNPRNHFLIVLYLSIFDFYCSSLLDVYKIKASEKLSLVNNDFGLTLFKYLSTNHRNDIISPFSLLSAFGILYNGANGITVKELKQFLKFKNHNINDMEINEGFKQLLRYFKTKDNKVQDSVEFELNIANHVIAQHKLKIKPIFSYILRENFNSEVTSVDIKNKGKETLELVNGWVRVETNEKIPHLLESPLDPLTELLILNAIYFQGNWSQKFSIENTKESDFLNNLNQKQRVKMMSIENMETSFGTSSELDAQLLELLYAGEALSLIVLLPRNQNGLNMLKSRLNSESLSSAIGLMSHRKVTVYLPKFKVDQKYYMMSSLSKTGLKVFNGGANLSKISDKKVLQISEVLHQVVIDVNEKGSEAAAVSSIGIFSRMRILDHIEFRADHPFIYLIVDKRNNLILFLGQINQLDSN